MTERPVQMDLNDVAKRLSKVKRGTKLLMSNRFLHTSALVEFITVNNEPIASDDVSYETFNLLISSYKEMRNFLSMKSNTLKYCKQIGNRAAQRDALELCDIHIDPGYLIQVLRLLTDEMVEDGDEPDLGRFADIAQAINVIRFKEFKRRPARELGAASSSS